MINAQLDVLELELRKLQGVRSVGFTTQHNVLYIQLFVLKDAPTANLPFEATRVAQRHSNSPIAVELVRWVDQNAIDEPSQSHISPKLASDFDEKLQAQEISSKAGSIGTSSQEQVVPQEASDELDDSEDDIIEVVEEIIEVEELPDEEVPAEEDEEDETPETFEEALESEIDLTAEDETQPETDRRDNERERIVLLTVSTSSDNNEIEVHLAYDEMRTVGRAPTNRGLLGAIDATVSAIEELKGKQDFHAEWARTLEPGPDQASLVAIGLTNDQDTDTRHGIAGGDSPIEAAARATLNALNRITELTTL